MHGRQPADPADLPTGRGRRAEGARRRPPLRLADLLLFATLRDRLGLSRVKSAATGGAALGPDTFRFFLAMGVPLRQLYGQTEAAGAYTLQDRRELDFDSSGVPFDDTEIRIHNPDPTGLGEIRDPPYWACSRATSGRRDETRRDADRGRLAARPAMPAISTRRAGWS